jgi:hypothetical protein
VHALLNGGAHALHDAERYATSSGPVLH